MNLMIRSQTHVFPLEMVPCLRTIAVAQDAARHLRSGAKHLRETLIGRYGRCLVTGWSNPKEFQAAHIVPRHVGYKLNFQRVNHPDNCILLANSLHTMFDDMIWTFDIGASAMQLRHNNGSDVGTGVGTGIGVGIMQIRQEIFQHSTFTASLLIRQDYNLYSGMLGAYANKTFVVPTCYLPSMYLHYQVWTDIAAETEITGVARQITPEEMTELYRMHMDSPTLAKLQELALPYSS